MTTQKTKRHCTGQSPIAFVVIIMMLFSMFPTNIETLISEVRHDSEFYELPVETENQGEEEGSQQEDNQEKEYIQLSPYNLLSNEPSIGLITINRFGFITPHLDILTPPPEIG